MRFNINISKVLSSESKYKILRILFYHGLKTSERSLARITGLSHMTVNRILNEFSYLNLVSVRRIGNSNVWEVNKSSYIYKILDKSRWIIDFKKEALDYLIKVLKNGLKNKYIKNVVLFGSFAKGKEKANSDIDLFILVKNKENKEKIEKDIEKLSEKCSILFGNTLMPYILDEKDYKNKTRKKIIMEIKNGIKIK